jgi:hypothetical protein
MGWDTVVIIMRALTLVVNWEGQELRPQTYFLNKHASFALACLLHYVKLLTVSGGWGCLVLRITH